MQDLLSATTLALALAKSKNVRNWRTYEGGDPAKGKLEPSTIDRRMDRYGESLGLEMGHNPIEEDGDVAPTPYKNQLETGRMDEDLLTSEHELGHAMMTPPGKKMRSYFKWLHGQNEVERQNRSAFSGIRNWRAQRVAEEEGIAGMRHERIASAISPKIQRRAGVAPGAHREYYPHNDYTPEEYDRTDRDLADRRGVEARKYVRRWDRGQRFDSEGRPQPPHGPDAAINDRARIAKQPADVVQGFSGPFNRGGGNLVNSPKARTDLEIHRDRIRERGPVKPAPLP